MDGTLEERIASTKMALARAHRRAGGDPGAIWQLQCDLAALMIEREVYTRQQCKVRLSQEQCERLTSMIWNMRA